MSVEQWNANQPKGDKDPSLYAINRAKSFPPSARIADIGGGAGADACYFLQLGHSVTLFDISDEALIRAKDRAQRNYIGNALTTVQINLENQKLPVPDNSFTIVYSRLALHYFYPEKTSAIFKEIYRTLDTSGKAFIVIKSPEKAADGTDELADIQQRVASGSAEVKGEGIFKDEGIIKTRFNTQQLHHILTDTGIADYAINRYVEDFSGRNDVTKSGNTQQVLHEIIFTKT